MDDYSKVGALLGALITTTVFLKRASLFNNILGGACELDLVPRQNTATMAESDSQLLVLREV